MVLCLRTINTSQRCISFWGKPQRTMKGQNKMRRNKIWVLTAPIFCLLLLFNTYDSIYAQIDPDFDSASMEALDMCTVRRPLRQNCVSRS